ncbi:MAG TPA: dephospho-CoA kinase [Bacillota bacterium]|nr:dephospho-CoA kinase [Bacillota bacterium]
MKIIGITGGIASGKSTVAQIIREMGYRVLDADQLARQVVEPGRPAYQEVIRTFGSEVLSPDGTLDRKKLAGIVFRDAEQRIKLEQIIHPAVKAAIRQEQERLLQSNGQVLFVEVPLLYEAGWEDFFDAVWVVSVTPKLQQERLLERDRLTPEEVMQRLAAQWPLSQKIKLADLVIENDGGYLELKSKVAHILNHFMQSFLA